MFTRASMCARVQRFAAVTIAASLLMATAAAVAPTSTVGAGAAGTAWTSTAPGAAPAICDIDWCVA